MDVDLRRVGTAVALYSVGYAGLTVLGALGLALVAPVTAGFLLLCLVGLGLLAVLFVLLGRTGTATRGLGGAEEGGITVSPVDRVTFHGEAIPRDALVFLYGAGLLALSFVGLVLVG